MKDESIVKKMKEFVLRFLVKSHEIRGFGNYHRIWTFAAKIKIKEALPLIQGIVKNNEGFTSVYSMILQQYDISIEDDKLIPHCQVCKHSQFKCSKLRTEVKKNIY